MTEPTENKIVAAGHFSKVVATARAVDEIMKNLPKWMAPNARVTGNYATAEVTREGTIQLTGEVLPADVPALLNWIASVTEVKFAVLRSCGHPAPSTGQTTDTGGISKTADSLVCSECENFEALIDLRGRFGEQSVRNHDMLNRLGSAEREIRDLRAANQEYTSNMKALREMLATCDNALGNAIASRNRTRSKLRKLKQAAPKAAKKRNKQPRTMKRQRT